MKPNVRHYSIFGDDHRAAIDAQIKVLSSRDMDASDIDDLALELRWSDYVTSGAHDALMWLSGDASLPSGDWESLVISNRCDPSDHTSKGQGT